MESDIFLDYISYIDLSINEAKSVLSIVVQRARRSVPFAKAIHELGKTNIAMCFYRAA